jgi:hypothetical protein
MAISGLHHHCPAQYIDRNNWRKTSLSWQIRLYSASCFVFLDNDLALCWAAQGNFFFRFLILDGAELHMFNIFLWTCMP